MAGVLAVVDDLFFLSKLQETARKVKIPLRTVRAADFRLEDVGQQSPGLVIVDLNATSGSPVELIRQLKTNGKLKQIPVLGFFSHVQVELQRAAQQAGCEQVLPRSKFTASLPALLQEFGGNRGQ